MSAIIAAPLASIGTSLDHEMSKSLTLLAALLLYTTTAFAHSPVKSTEPANGDVLDAVPAAIDISFAKPARLMKVEVIHTVGDVSETIRLEIPTREQIEDISLIPGLSVAGDYSVNWRALGEDGHVVMGTFSFSVTGN